MPPPRLTTREHRRVPLGLLLGGIGTLLAAGLVGAAVLTASLGPTLAPAPSSSSSDEAVLTPTPDAPTPDDPAADDPTPDDAPGNSGNNGNDNNGSDKKSDKKSDKDEDDDDDD